MQPANKSVTLTVTSQPASLDVEVVIRAAVHAVLELLVANLEVREDEADDADDGLKHREEARLPEPTKGGHVDLVQAVAWPDAPHMLLSGRAREGGHVRLFYCIEFRIVRGALSVHFCPLIKNCNISSII